MIAFVLKHSGVLKFGAMLLVATTAYLWARNNGVQAERVKWEKASTSETARQVAVNDAAREASDAAALALAQTRQERDELVRRLSDEAADETNAGDACIGPTGVMRLNAIGAEAPAD